MRLRSVALSIATIMLLGVTSLSPAHRAPGSLTTIKWNGATGRTEIIHRLHVHDAELAVGTSMDIPDLSVGDIEGRAYIALYVEERFHIKGKKDELPLELVGAELAGNYVLVYQELPGRLPQKILIRDDIMRDAFPAQLNQVNIEDGDSVHSIVFTKKDGWLSYDFRGASMF